MEDFLYAYNQPKKFAKYDLILDGKIIADEVVTKSGSIGGGEDTSNCVKINEPITITEGDNTTSITSDTISTTTLSGTLDAESMKNSLTAEAIQNVAPIVWRGDGLPTIQLENATNCVLFGSYANCRGDFSTSIGASAGCYNNGTAVGYFAKAKASYATSIGQNSTAGAAATALGYKATSVFDAKASITIGAQFTETTDNGDVTHYCTTEGTGSITIGAGANTLNNGDIESSNSVTIGCKAENKGADSVVIGAAVNNTGAGNVTIGAGAQTTYGDNVIAIGANAKSIYGGIAIGASADTINGAAVAIGNRASGHLDSVSLGRSTFVTANGVAIGTEAKANAVKTIAIGKSATITNTGDTQSENTTVIGYGASASAPNAVVLGAGAGAGTTNAFAEKTVTIGVGATTLYREAIAIGHNAKSTSFYSIGLGGSTVADGNGAFALGFGAESHSIYSTAIGTYAKAKNDGVVVFASFDNASMTTKTQLYFSGANTPLANEYYNGEAMMGYTVTDSAGTVLACGTRRLSELFPDNSLTQPATIDENGEWVIPKVFHPSDLDLPIEEPSEPEDVEINIRETEVEEYKPLPIYPIVEPTIDEITE